MNRNFRFVVFLFVLAGLVGYLLSKASWVGRAGISLFYRQYGFFKTWWQGGLLVFVVWALLFFLQGRMARKSTLRTFKLVQIGALVVAAGGLFFTFQDFQHNTTHRWLGERFHLGGYLFWLGWMAISIFHLTKKTSVTVSAGKATVEEI